MDLILVNNNTLVVADLKSDEKDALKSLPQVASYGIMLKRLLFKRSSDFKEFSVQCIIFTKDEVWEFEPDALGKEIIKFIKYANSLRERSLKSMTYEKNVQRRDLLEDIEKVVK